MQPLLSLHNVSVARGVFRKREVLRRVCLDVHEGDRVVLLGPNGAGKTTLIGAVTGAVSLSSGTVKTAQSGSVGSPVVASLPQQSAQLARLRAVEQVAYSAWLRGRPRSEVDQAALDALKAVGLEEMAQRRVERMSGGELRRVGLAGCLATGAEVLLLDEPTAGLDPAERRRFRDILGQTAGGAVVVTTHETHDVAGVFNRVVVLAKGNIVHDGATDEFVRTFSPNGSIEDAYLECIRGSVAA